ncbi:hypothetical protein [Nocardioides sp. zg-DK7169]|uniref:hypothetical protein n=1 Tax=Nocardioides sp. zg-DK7169 TaxID=2736600 RepID=UPI0015524591|nr:hypothetical protein [Nocardioides sp. zg-DK7169]NPC96521.1 hypothetical protein [Nocardioides sp. zg-DK7169]
MDSPAPLALSSSPRVRLALSVVGVAALLGAVAWYVNSPAALPTSKEAVVASTPAGTPVHVGVFGAGADFDRSLTMSGVRVRVVSDVPVEVEPLLCRHGSFRVTTDPLAFCEEVLDSEDVEFGAGDTVALRVSGTEPGTVRIEPVRLAFAEGLQRGVRTAGASSQVTLLAR